MKCNSRKLITNCTYISRIVATCLARQLKADRTCLLSRSILLSWPPLFARLRVSPRTWRRSLETSPGGGEQRQISAFGLGNREKNEGETGSRRQLSAPRQKTPVKTIAATLLLAVKLGARLSPR